MARMPASLTLWVVLGLLASSCAAPRKIVYTHDELRAELSRRVPENLARHLVVPFIVEPNHTRAARNVTRWNSTAASRASALLDAVRDSDDLGVQYVPAATTTAAETLAAKQGNCLSIASVVVGLARSLGLTSYYVDISHREEEIGQQGEFIVRSGHVAAVIVTGDGFVALDVGSNSPRLYYDWHAMDDLTATAHFYNNRGYEFIHFSLERNLPVPWNQVHQHFRLATLIQPNFARAWNNLGVAAARLGLSGEAEEAYWQATLRDPSLPSALANLGAHYLEQERYGEAAQALERALELDDENPRLAYYYGLALWHAGRTEEAMAALERSIDDGYGPARVLLARLVATDAGCAGGEGSDNGAAASQVHSSPPAGTAVHPFPCGQVTR